MKIILFAILIGLSLPIGAQNLGWMEGDWVGEGYQPNAGTQQVWNMTLSFSTKSGDPKIKIDYPSLSCGSNWVLQSSEVNRAIFIENLTYGKTKCIDGSKLIVSFIDENYLSITFYGPPGSVEIYATALLKRK